MRITSLDYVEILKALGEGFGTSIGNSLSIYFFFWKKFSILSNRFILRPEVYDFYDKVTLVFLYFLIFKEE